MQHITIPMSLTRRISLSIAIATTLACCACATWYTMQRRALIARTEHCQDQLAHPETIPHLRAPDGTIVPVMTPCLIEVVPPTMLDLLRGRMTFTGVPDRMKVAPYSFADMILGRYSLSIDISLPCDQAATTTDCSTFSIPSQVKPQPYMPPPPVQTEETWISATGTPISLYGFSFELPAGWHGSVNKDAYTGNLHALMQRDGNDHGFTIDCPPDSKGLESATRLTNEQRSYTSSDDTSYSIALEKWTAPGNDSWYFLWVRMPQSGDSSSNNSSGTYCLAQGTVTPEIEKAMQTMYESWNQHI